MNVTHWIIWVLGDPEQVEAARTFSLQVVDPDRLGAVLPGSNRKESSFVIAGDCAAVDPDGLEKRKKLVEDLKKLGVIVTNIDLAADGTPVLNMDSTTIFL